MFCKNLKNYDDKNEYLFKLYSNSKLVGWYQLFFVHICFILWIMYIIQLSIKFQHYNEQLNHNEIIEIIS